MHQFKPDYVSHLFEQHPERVKDLIQLARTDFQSYFISCDQFEKLADFLDTDYILYSRLCYLLGNEEIKKLMLAALNYLWQAYSRDRSKTLQILATCAVDFDAATTNFWSLIKRYQPIPWKDETLLLRDKISELLTFASEYIEGVIKKEIWALLAFRDLANGQNKDPFRWQAQNLGNMISSATSLCEPLGSYLSRHPVPNIPLNQFRNIGAHKNYNVVKSQIFLFPSTRKIQVTLTDLDRALDIIGTIRMFLKLFGDLAVLQYLEDVMALGYQPIASPETSIIEISTSLGLHGILVESVKREKNDTWLYCSSKNDYADKELLFTILSNLPIIATIYSDTFSASQQSKLRISIRKKDNSILNASCNLHKAITMLNQSGDSEIKFEIEKNGVRGTANLKFQIQDNSMVLY